MNQIIVKTKAGKEFVSSILDNGKESGQMVCEVVSKDGRKGRVEIPVQNVVSITTWEAKEVK